MLGRAEWGEIRSIGRPPAEVVRVCSAVRVLLGEAVVDERGTLPTEWPACVKLLGDRRFLSRVLRLTSFEKAPSEEAVLMVRHAFELSPLDHGALQKLSRTAKTLGELQGSAADPPRTGQSPTRALAHTA